MIDEITGKTSLPVLEQSVTGAKTTTMAVGGAFRFFIEPQNVQQLCTVISVLKENNQRWRILGAGSNLIIADQGISEWVIRLGKGFRSFDIKGAGVFQVFGSMPLMSLCRELSEAGYSGLEFSGGIPASLGGAVRMNAGAHGGSMGDVIESVSVVTGEGIFRTFEKTELNWGYRRSIFGEGLIVVSAMLRLASGDSDAIQRKRLEFLQERKKRQPLTAPSAGSIFKNPPNQSAGAVLEAAGMKGVRIGKAEVSQLHANWIINPTKEALASDIESLITLCKDKVRSTSSIVLEREVIGWN